MDDFEKLLETVGEVGVVEEIMHSIVYVSGLPLARPYEAIFFENGNIGQVLSLTKERVEVLILDNNNIRVGTRAARTNVMLQVPISNELIGRMIDPLGRVIDDGPIKKGEEHMSAVDTQPHGIIGRKKIETAMETGVSIADIIVPLAKGQRELVIGDRKTGKTEFLLQIMENQSKLGTVCIYAVIGQRKEDIKRRYEFMKEKGILKNGLVVATSSSDESGLIFFTPFTAMTIAEFFRDQGKDVLLILDDMTTHARIYREISLLARRFPGRNAYPGDIFYLHSRIIERAGNFRKGSITALPVAETIMGDLSGYLQTNLMAMTDGHIFFDIDLYNSGKRPAVSPFLSVTRVGHQAQTPLLRDVSRQVLSLLVSYERMKQFVHFGAEAGDTIRGIIELGKKVDIFFDQTTDELIPINANLIVLAAIWSGMWNETPMQNVDTEIEKIVLNYNTDAEYKKKIDKTIAVSNNFSDLINIIRTDSSLI